MLSVYRMVKHIIKIVQHLLQDFHSVYDHFMDIVHYMVKLIYSEAHVYQKLLGTQIYYYEMYKSLWYKDKNLKNTC